MQKIPLSLARTDMKLAKEVADQEGRVLCSSGVVLERNLIEKLQRLGVKFVTVEGHPIQFPWERPLTEDLKLLRARFSKVKDDPRLQVLHEAIKSYWITMRKEDE